jgi:hypothetical protein
MQLIFVSTAHPLRPSRRPNRPHRGVITITGIGDHLRPEWPITITGTRRQSVKFYARRRGNPSIPLPRGTHRGLGLFAMDAQKPDNGARLSHNPRKNFFRSVNYLTLLNRFLNDAA